MPSISVILPTRNRPDFLLEALQSVARQNHSEIELVLVRDGGSPLDERARAILEGLEFPYMVVERDDPPEGLAQARDTGMAQARGDAFAFLDDDDLWDPGHVKQLAVAMDKDPELAVVYSDAKVIETSSGQERLLAVDFDLQAFGRNSFIAPSAFAASRAAFEEFGGFDPKMAYSEDWDWLLRVGRSGGKIARVRGVSATIRIHSGGLSALVPERLAERQRFLDELSKRHRLAPIKPKTFWEVAGDLCPDGSASKH
ncbi:MAG: glycosyltransferase family 2 protein [Candidatus Eiseniibacteriota bacterium]